MVPRVASEAVSSAATGGRNEDPASKANVNEIGSSVGLFRGRKISAGDVDPNWSIFSSPIGQWPGPVECDPCALRGDDTLPDE